MTPQEKALARLLDILCEEPQAYHRDDPLSAKVSASFKSRCAVLKDSIEKGAYTDDTPWKPKIGDMYWVISTSDEDGYHESQWDGERTDYFCLSRGLVFRTEEEAREKAKSYGWIV